MKIAHVSALPVASGRGPVGGVGTYTVALLKLLERSPLQNVVVCNDDAGVTPSLLPANASALPAWRFGDPGYPRAVRRAIDRIDPDVVHLQQELFLYGPGPRALLFPMLLKKLVRSRHVVATVHGVTTDREIDSSLMQGRRSIVPLALVRGVIVGIFRAIARSGAHLVVHGEVLKERLVELGAKPERVTVIPHPLFEVPAERSMSQAGARAALGLAPDAQIVLTWGYWNGYKGLEELARGFSIYRRTHPKATLILGTGPHPQLRNDAAYMESYDAAMRELAGIGEGIVHAGFIDDAALPRYVRASDVCVFAYTKYLASSGPATYAVTLGSPVLLSSVFPEAPPAIAFAPTPEGIAAALDRFFADPQTHARASQELAEAASEEKLRERYELLYRRLLE